MAKKLPFLVTPKQEIIAIGTPDHGIIHLLRKGGISPNENPVDLQEAGTRQAKVQIMLQSAVNRLAKEAGISKSEARKQLFAMPVKSAEDGETLQDDDVPSMYDHLSPEETQELLALREDTAKVAIDAATLFIRYRVAFPVQILSAAKSGAKTLAVAPLSFPIPDDSIIAFASTKVRVLNGGDVGSESLNVKAIDRPLDPGEIGYLCAENGRYKVGDSEWSTEDTREALTEVLIAQIYGFYQAEMAGVPYIPESLTEGTEESQSAKDGEGEDELGKRQLELSEV